MNIIFMGTPQFAVPSLEALLNSHHKIQAVVTAADKPKGRGLKITQSPVKQFAAENGIKLLQPLNLKDNEFIDELKQLTPELIVIVAFRILPPEVFTLPKFGSVNLHASLLPKYRGAAPINRAIINGETLTGVTTFFLKEKVDTGNIILQKAVPVSDEDNFGSLHDGLMNIGAALLLETINLIETKQGDVPLTAQDEKQASPAPKIFKEECRILWNVPVVNVHNLIRGLAPYPGAFTIFNNKVVKIYKSTLTDIEKINKPGDLIVIKNDMFVSASDYMLKIEEIQPEGKRRMKIAEFLAGNRIKKGDKFMY
jgi:methionyl-tRNA formyltransferase